MYEKLENFLDRNTSPMKRGIVLAGLDILDKYGLVAAWSEISQMLDTSNDIDAPQLLLDVEVIINTGLNNVLSQHQIEVEGFLAIKIDILEGLKILMDYEDSTTILQFCDLDDDSVQTLSDLLEIVTDRTWADYSDVLKSVSPSLIRKLAELHRTKGEDDGVERAFTVEPARRDALIKHFNTYVMSLTKQAISEDLTMIGTPFNMIANRYREQLADLQPMAAKQAAIEMVGLSLASDTSLTDFVRSTKDRVDEIYSDINFITQVDSEIDNVVKEVMGRG
jgi:hypothetical protein